jgi:nitrite reductase/ring-hydroxylating ferredoxin subunit
MPLVRVAALAALPPGTLTEVIAGEERYAVGNVDGEVFALDGICPHSGGPLGQGALHGDIVVCPWHAWEYHCRSGFCVHEDKLKLETFAVKIEGGDVFIDVP